MLGFYWILKNEIAGAPQPGLYGEWDDQINFIKKKGIDYVLCLTEQPLIENQLKKEGFGFIHLPIRDMDAPLVTNASKAIHEMKNKIEEGHKFLIHCKGGVGRTGMMAACYLVLHGLNAEEAVKKVRSVHHPYIQTLVQERFVGNFEVFEQKVS